jgi:hypothetical protein
MGGCNEQDIDDMQETVSEHAEIASQNVSGFQLSFSFFARILLGMVFIFASIDKMLHPAAFAQNIYAYQLLPESWISALAVTLPWLEVVLGCLLITGVWLPGAVTLVNLLLVTFFAALAFNMARGLDVDCGCFSTGPKSQGAMWTYLLRDLIFLLISGYLFFQVVVDPKWNDPKDGRQEGGETD